MNKIYKSFILIFVILLNNSSAREYLPEQTFGFYGEIDVFSEFKDARESLVKWMKNFGERRNAPIEIKFYDNMNFLYKDYKRNKLGGITVYTNFFFENYDEIKRNSSDFWSLSYSEENKTTLCLISNKKSKINGFKDIKDKNLSIKNNNLYFSWLNKESLKLHKKPVRKVLKKLIYERKESRILLNVYFKKVELGIIDKLAWNTMLELNPAILKEIKMLKCIDFPTSSFIGLFKKGVAIERNKKIFFDFTQNIENYEDSKEFFSLMNFNHVYKIKKSDLEKMNLYFKEYRKLERKYK